MKTAAFRPHTAQQPARQRQEPAPAERVAAHVPHTPKTLTEVEGIDEVYVYCSDEGIRALLPEGVRLLLRDRVARPRHDARTGDLRQLHRPRSGPTSTSSPTPPRPSSAPRPSPMRSGKVRFGRIRLGVQRRKDPDFRLVRGPSAQLFALDNIPRTQTIEPVYIETSAFFIFSRELWCGRGRRRIGDQSLHGRRGPHRGFGHRLPRGLRHGRNHRGEPEPAGINKSRFCELADSEDFRFAGGESAGRSSALRKPAIPHAP